MNRDKVFFLVIIIIVILIVLNTFNGGESRQEYIDRMIRERADKDLFFKNNDESPIPDSLEFTGLSYFPPNPDYKLSTSLAKLTTAETITLATSDGLEKKYKKFGYAEFEFEGKKNRLLLLEMEPPFQDKLFIPFADETSGIETYGAGRYLEVDKPTGESVILDFNLAYNPYCAYSSDFSCPFPPVENLLFISVRAGEKKYN
jgi:hypothetical protein